MMKKILFFEQDSTFVKEDLKILQKHFTVETIKFKTTILSMIWTIFAIARNDMVYIWFGNHHAAYSALVAKLLRKRVIIVAGGYDAASVPELKYGFMQHPIKKYFAKLAFNSADIVLAVSLSTMDNVEKYSNASNVKLVYLGVDPTTFKLDPKATRDTILTVCQASDWSRLVLKGVDKFIEVSKKLPQYNFMVIGVTDKALNKLQSMAGPNVKFRPSMPRAELEQYYNKAKIYCQLSRQDSFSLTTAEAMLCGATPVITKNVGIGEVIFDHAEIVDYGDIDETVRIIEEVMSNKTPIQQKRDVILGLTPLKNREEALKDLI